MTYNPAHLTHVQERLLVFVRLPLATQAAYEDKARSLVGDVGQWHLIRAALALWDGSPMPPPRKPPKPPERHVQPRAGGR
jgi:hypothetical protein